MSAFWAGKRVVVTGGTGFLGQHLVQQLRQVGAVVSVLDLHPGPWDDVPTHICNVLDEAGVRRVIAGSEIVFHTAGTVAIWGKGLQTMHLIHCQGTRNVLKAARFARVVHTSSLVAVGASRDTTPVTEDTPFNLGDIGIAYITAKRAAEEIALQAAGQGQDVVVVNPAYMIGPQDNSRSITGRYCKRFWSGRVIAATPGGLNLVDVRDVARGHLLAAERGQSGRRYILGGEDHTSRSLLALMAQVAHMRPRWIPQIPLVGLTAIACLAELRGWLTAREPYPSLAHVRLNRWNFFCKSTRACQELGYTSRPLSDCLRDTYNWHRAHGLKGPRNILRWWLRAA